MFYRSYIAFVPDRKEWCCVIRNELTNTVVTMGCFHYEAQAVRWSKDAIKRKAWRDASELPDIYG
jgi:hypothetical protein